MKREPGKLTYELNLGEDWPRSRGAALRQLFRSIHQGVCGVLNYRAHGGAGYTVGGW